MTDPERATEIGRLPLLVEVPSVHRHRRITGRVRVSVTTAEQQQQVAIQRLVQRAEIERVPIGREVDEPPPTRREGDVLIVPVVEEKLVVIRRLVVTEELRIRLHEQVEPETMTMPFLRQTVQVDRIPALPSTGDNFTGETPMNRTITAMFDSRAEAEQGAQQLRGLGAQDVRIHAAEAQTSEPEADTGFLASIANLFVPDDDRATYGEGMRRGSVLVSAEVAEGSVDAAMDALEAAGAVDLDTREEEWRGAGWAGGSAAGAAGTSLTGPGSAAKTPLSGGIAEQADIGTRGANLGSAGTGVAGAPTGAVVGTGAASMQRTDQATATSDGGREETIKMAEERLRVGKREAHAGRVRVRSYVTETPVEEQVTLREERVHVDQRPLDRPATAAEASLFQDRTIEAEESIEEAVIQKDVRVTGEVVVSKDAIERTETIRDTVRRTEVDVDQDSVANDALRNKGKGAA